ncbi:nucleolar transcription factor 1-like isoform X1 [Lampetra fluviatilis]
MYYKYSDYNISGTRRDRGARRRRLGDLEWSDAHGAKRGSIPLGRMNGEMKNEAAGESPATADKDAEDVWSKQDLFMLLERMKSVIPENDSMKFKTTEQHLDWEKVKFSNFTGDMCKEKWLKLSSEIRKFRTLTELLVDAKEHVKNPYKGKKIKSHPDFPKKPLTPYFRFFMAKRAKYAKMHPDLTNLDLTKILSTKYKEMTEKKKLKYMEDYQRDKEEFDKAMAKFREQHPDLVEVAVRKSDVPEKPKTPQQLWYHHEKKAYIKLHPEMNLKEVNETLRRQWSVLPDKKRLKWIAKALELQRQHALELKEYICTHPEYVPNDAKSVLSKAEWLLKDKHDGRPTKPPPNGYSLFCAELIASLKDVPSTERMHECSRQWKVLSPKEKDAYHKRCEQKKKQYEIDFQKFVENLTDEERERIQLEERAKEGGKMASLATAAALGKDITNSPGPTSAVDRPQRPISAMFIFSQEKRKKLRKKNPDLPESELTRLLARLWSELSEKKKEKYKKLEAAMKADYEQKMQTQLKEKKDSASNSSARRGRMPDPPKTPEELFQMSKLEEYLARFKNDRKKTTRALEVEWKALEKKQKMPWIKAAAESQKRYDKQVAEMKTAPAKKAHFEGEPKKPPTSGYQMFSQQLLSNGELSHITLRERMMEIGRRWQKIGQGQKDRYKQLAEEAQKKYKAQLEAWIKTLPAADKALYKEFVTNKRKGSAKPSAVTAKAKPANKKLKKEESEDEDDEESSEDEDDDDEEEGDGQEESSEGDNDSDDDDDDDDDENEDDDEEDGEEGNNNSSDSESSSEEGSDSDSD